MNITDKQLMIMDVIIKGNPDGEPCDLDQLIERVPYEVSKPAIQFSIRYLIQKGLLRKLDRELRRGKSRVILGATKEAFQLLRPGGPYVKVEI